MSERPLPLHHVPVTPERWGRVVSVFDGAFPLDDQARSDFLARECDDDAVLRAQVVEMLRGADAPHAFLDATDVLPPGESGSAVSPAEGEPALITPPAAVPSIVVSGVPDAGLSRRRKLIATIAIVSLVIAAGAMALAWQARAAEARAASAERRLGDAHTLARAVLGRYLDAIASLAVGATVREHFVRDGLTYLDQLSARPIADRALQLELAEAYRRSAELQVGALPDRRADTAGAIASLQKAVVILDALTRRDAGDAGARSALTAVLRPLGGLLRETGELPQARAVLERVVVLAGTPAAAATRDPVVALALQQQHHDLGQVLVGLGDTATARREFNTALAALDAIPDGARTTAAVREAYAVTLQQLADLTAGAGPPAVALQATSRVVALRQAMVSADPTNHAQQRALALAYEREGETLSRLGRHADAMRSYQSASQLAETLLRGDRTNPQYRADVARTLARRGDMASLAGDVETAIGHFRASLAVQRQLARRDTASVAVRLATIDAHARLARSHARLQQTTEALAELARTESAMDGTRVDSADVATRSAFGDTYVSLAEAYLTLRGQGAADALAAGICRKAGRMFDRAELLLADLLARERASARDSSRLIASRSLRASARTQCPAG